MYWYSLRDQRRMSIKQQQHSCFVWDQLVNSQHFFFQRKALESSKRREKIVTSTLDVGLFFLSLSLAMIDSRLRWVHIPVGCARRRQAAFYFYFNRNFLSFSSLLARAFTRQEPKSMKIYFCILNYTLKKWLIFFFEKNVRFLPTLAAAAAFGLSQIHT